MGPGLGVRGGEQPQNRDRLLRMTLCTWPSEKRQGRNQTLQESLKSLESHLFVYSVHMGGKVKLKQDPSLLVKVSFCSGRILSLRDILFPCNVKTFLITLSHPFLQNRRDITKFCLLSGIKSPFRVTWTPSNSS